MNELYLCKDMTMLWGQPLGVKDYEEKVIIMRYGEEQVRMEFSCCRMLFLVGTFEISLRNVR